MEQSALHRFEQGGRKFVVDPETCFCFECDEISWEVVDRYPHTPLNRIYHDLESRFSRTELEEVVGELEWLRACKSILPPVRHESLREQFTLARGLRLLTLELPPTSIPPTIIHDAATLLLARSGEHKALRLVVRTASGDVPRFATDLARACAETAKLGQLAGKELAVLVAAAMPKGALGDHLLRLCIELGLDASGNEAALLALSGSRLAKVVKAVADIEDIRLSAELQPRHPDFVSAVAELVGVGFEDISLDLDGVYFAPSTQTGRGAAAVPHQPGINPEAMLDGARAVAVQYAQDLLKGRYYRLEPMAGLFKRIYDGTPLRRADGIGIHELALDAAGKIYPSAYLLGKREFCIGDIGCAELDEAALAVYDDVGSLTTPACIHCWARNFCGGGTAAVHHALSGSFRQPAVTWCNAQRAWTASAIAAFNVLSSNGVNFTRIHAGLGRSAAKPSWFTLARAAIRMQLGIRNIEERDADWLQAWENWNPAAYFTLHESGMLMATRYDREMDSLHPKPYEHEFVIVRKDGTPCGLLRVRPERVPGLATAWLYFRDPRDYADSAVQRSFRAILDEAGRQQAVATLIAPVGPHDHGLKKLLLASGFTHAGTAREALYLHGTHHDANLYALALK